MKNVVIACGLQRAYFHSSGTMYLGDKAEILKIRLVEFFKSLSSDYVIFFAREVHQSSDKFYMSTKSYAAVGSPDVEILEVFKPYVKMIINIARYDALYKTVLDSELSKIKPHKVYIVGAETHTNILYTTAGLRYRDYDVVVPEPLVTAQEDYMHTMGITLLSNTLSAIIE